MFEIHLTTIKCSVQYGISIVVSSLYCITYNISYIFSLIPDLIIHTCIFLSSMPNRCSVANCCSNYDGTDYVPVFEMLNHWSKGMQDEWRRFLHRDDAWKLARVFICARHSVTRIYYLTSIFPRVTVQ